MQTYLHDSATYVSQLFHTVNVRNLPFGQTVYYKCGRLSPKHACWLRDPLRGLRCCMVSCAPLGFTGVICLLAIAPLQAYCLPVSAGV